MDVKHINMTISGSCHKFYQLSKLLFGLKSDVEVFYEATDINILFVKWQKDAAYLEEVLFFLHVATEACEAHR